MKLVRWNPDRVMANPMDLFDRFFDNMLFPRTIDGEGKMNWVPRVEITEEDEKFEITAELPGMGKDNINILIDNGTLTIRGEKKLEDEKKEKNYHLLERRYGEFVRRFKLPENVDADKINAEYKDGILKLTVPKTEAAKPKEIKVKVD